MDYKKLIPWAIVVVLLVILFTRKEQIETIYLPAKTGKWVNTNPQPIKVIDTKSKITGEIITVNTYKETYKDENQEITVETKTTGTIIEQKVDYVILPQKVEVKTKESRIHLFAGVVTDLTPEINVKPTLYLQTNTVLFSGSYSLQTKGFSVGAAIKLF